MPAASVLLLVTAAVVVGAAAAAAGARVWFRRDQPTFRCKIRACGYPLWPLPRQWGRWRDRAAWVHDVLLVQRGIVRPRTLALPVRAASGEIQYSSRAEVARLGASPVVLVLRLDDDDIVEVAARETDITALAGPFLTAAIPGRPAAPTDRRRPLG